MNWKPELDDLARREPFSREMGGAEKVQRQHDKGRLTVRERTDRLVDRNGFHEVGAISGSAEHACNDGESRRAHHHSPLFTRPPVLPAAK